MAGYLIIINNYLHDVATAMILSLTVIMVFISSRAGDGPEERERFAAEIYSIFSKLAALSLAWVIAGGIPRAIFFNRYELIPAREKGIAGVLVFKHIILFMMVAAGLLLWRRIRNRLKR
ncbi:MAG: hypothetical protein CVU89_15315 [Firmicutes bacterium HGW-Firmicutes-14]|nr:MAG: hypothetical protein CVU89_15315 [Firmicutes bacterium HGW-Firmicutes-14]